MKLDIKELFNNSYVISINKTRYSQFNRIFLKTHKNLKLPKLFYGIEDRVGHEGCRKSHLGVILEAKKLDLPYVLIFEDDAYPHDEIVNDLQAVLNDLPDDIEYLALGYSGCINKSRKFQIPDEIGLVKFSNDKYSDIIGSHAQIIFKNIYDKVIKILSNKHTFSDRQPRRNVNFYFLNPCLYITFNNNKSMAFKNQIGYCYPTNSSPKIFNTPPIGFSTIEEILK